MLFKKRMIDLDKPFPLFASYFLFQRNTWLAVFISDDGCFLYNRLDLYENKFEK